MGDPSGVGAEVVLKALADPELATLAKWVVVGDTRILKMAGQITNATVRDVRSLESLDDFEFGKLDARYGQAAVDYVRVATEMCLADEAHAMVTAPLNKEAVTLSGRQFSGHTEYIAESAEQPIRGCCFRARFIDCSCFHSRAAAASMRARYGSDPAHD